MNKPTYALALAGGGTRGAFEVGVWQALKELGIEISAIVGTSIGAVNGAVFSSGVESEELWKNISATDIIDIEGDNMFSFASLISTIKQIANGGVDATAFDEFLTKHIDEDKIRNSKIEYGLCTYRTDTKETKELFVNQIPQGELVDYIAASANFPVFKRKKIDGIEYIDGGVKNNLPINMLIEKGYDTIITVTVKGIGLTKNIDHSGINLIGINCHTPEVGIMEFDADGISRSMKSGYYECMRVFGKYAGKLYSITPESYNDAQLIYGKDLINGVEAASIMCGIDPYRVYTFDELCNKLMINYKSSKKLSLLVKAMSSAIPARGVLERLGKFYSAANAVVYLKKQKKIT